MSRTFWLTSLVSWLTASMALAQSPPVQYPGDHAATVQETGAPDIGLVLIQQNASLPNEPDVSLALSDDYSGEQPAKSPGQMNVPGVNYPPAAGYSPVPATNYHSAPATTNVTVTDQAACGAVRPHCDLHSICNWLFFRTPPCGRACHGCGSQPVCRPEFYEYLLPCAGGTPPRAAGCTSCGSH
jgi:hypothetical protein